MTPQGFPRPAGPAIDRSASVRALLGLVLGAACAVVIACGGAASKSGVNQPGVAPTAVQGGGVESPGGTKQQIEQLDAEIESQLKGLDLARPMTRPCGPDHPCDVVAMSNGVTQTQADPQCHPGTSDTCTQSCTLGKSICDNAGKICSLAQQLGDDAWAQNKCASGKASCEAAHAKCCNCMP
jgi:hypothetical protein